jgi:hypothetical protein
VCVQVSAVRADRHAAAAEIDELKARAVAEQANMER